MSTESWRRWITFEAQRAKRQLICEVSRKFVLIFNFRSADVTNEVVLIALELQTAAARPADSLHDETQFFPPPS
jgi:hypothetical protein